MLLLVTNRKSTGGFFSRRRADKGKIPPAILGTKIGHYTAARLGLSGRKLSGNLHYLQPYLQRGDVLVASRALEPTLHYNAPLIAEYARRQCVNFCLAAIRAAERHRRTQVALIDKEGECVGVAAELLGVCDTVWVATRRPELFLPCAAYTRQRYGCEPLMAENDLPDVDLVIAPYGTLFFSVDSAAKVAAPDRLLYPLPSDMVIPDYVALSTPSDTDPLAVTAGLFRAFYPGELMEAVPEVIHWGRRLITPRELLE